MKKFLSIVAIVVLLLSISTPASFASNVPFEISGTDITTIEFEDVITFGAHTNLKDFADASSGSFVTEGWGSTSKKQVLIPIQLEKSGLYDVEFSLNGTMSDSYSNWSLSYGDLILGETKDATIASYTIGQWSPKLNVYQKKGVYMEEGETSLVLDFSIINAHIAFYADYIKFTPVTGASVSGKTVTEVDFDEFTASLSGVERKSAASAMGGSYNYSGWTSAKSVLIPLDIDKSTAYDIEYILGQPTGSNYYGWTLSLGETELASSNMAVGTKTEVEAVSSELPMMEFKNEEIYLEQGIHILTLSLHDGASSGKHTFAADRIKFTPYPVAGEAEVVIDSFTIRQGKAHVSGRILNSVGDGYSGLSTQVYITLPGGEPSLAGEAVSAEDGSFCVEYVLPTDDVRGDCLAEVTSEFGAACEETCYYVSDRYLTPFLTELKGTEDADGVEAVFARYETLLGIDSATDFQGISDFDKVYERFIAADITELDVFRTRYREIVAVEKVNQATDTDQFRLAVENNQGIFGVDVTKLSALEDADAFYGAVRDALVSSGGAESAKEFAALFEASFNQAFAGQLGLSNIALADKTLSAREGQKLQLDIVSTEDFNAIKEIELSFVMSGALKDAFIDLAIDSELGETTISSMGDTVTCRIDITEPEISQTEIGALSFAGTKAGTGAVTVGGTALVQTEAAYDVMLNVLEKTYAVTIQKQVSQDIGGGNSSTGGSRGNGSRGGGALIMPIEPPAVEDKTETVQAAVFSDLSQAEWAREAIDYLTQRNVFNRAGDGKFYPNRNITRAEFVKMIVLAKDLYTGSTTTVDFSDVQEGDWYYQYVEAALTAKLIEGDGSGTFRPNDFITRQDICVILSRLMQTKNADMTAGFSDDADISEYAKTAVYAMKEQGIIDGVGDNLFAPKSNATRAMAAKIIYGIVR